MELLDKKYAKTFIIYIILGYLLAGIVQIVLLALGIDLSGTVTSAVIPLVVAMAVAARYYRDHKSIPETRILWRAAFRFALYNLALQLVLAALGTYAFWSEIQSFGAGTFFTIVLVVLTLVFLGSWPLIRLGLGIGMKSEMKTQERKAEKNKASK